MTPAKVVEPEGGMKEMSIKRSASIDALLIENRYEFFFSEIDTQL